MQNTFDAKEIVGRLPVMSMQFLFMPANPGVELKKIPTPLERKLERNFAAWMMAPVKTIEADFRLTILSTF